MGSLLFTLSVNDLRFFEHLNTISYTGVEYPLELLLFPSSESEELADENEYVHIRVVIMVQLDMTVMVQTNMTVKIGLAEEKGSMRCKYRDVRHYDYLSLLIYGFQ